MFLERHLQLSESALARGAVKSRQEEEVEVTRTELAPNLFCLELMLQAEMARELVNPGAFLLLRALELPPQAWVPVSVVEVRGEKVRVVVYVDGPKTRFLVKPASHLVVKGPFYNGVQGLAILKRVRDGLGLIIAGEWVNRRQLRWPGSCCGVATGCGPAWPPGGPA